MRAPILANGPEEDKVQILVAGALAWGIVGAMVALAALRTVAGDVAPVLVAASVLFPLCAVLAAVALARGHRRLAGALLVLSAATPTSFAWALNLPALAAGLVLLVRGRSPATP